MKTEAYIKKLIEETGLTKKEIQDLVEEKKQELKGLISEEGALFIIAKELGVDVKEENKDLLKDIDINIADITSNMKNITLVGRIKDIYRITSFTKKDGSEGHVGSFLLYDNTGDIRIVLWDEQINIFKEQNFAKNELVKLINGYAKNRTNKEGIPSGIEIHLGRLSKIIIAPEDIDYKKYPKMKDELVSIGDISLTQKSISIEGQVLQKYPIKEFKRKTGEIGKVGSIFVKDSTGTIRITFWNEDTEKMSLFEVGDVILISSLNPKLSNLDSKTIDLFISRSSTIKKLKKKIDAKFEVIENIKLIQNLNNLVSFKGVITSIENLKKITSKSGEEIPLLNFEVSDETDYIRGTLWRGIAEKFSKILSSGVGVLLKDVMIRYSNFSGRKEVSFMDTSTLEVIDLEFNNLKSKAATKDNQKSVFNGKYTSISSIDSAGIYEIKGFVAKELSKITLYEACPNCFKKLENCSCENREDSIHRMIFNLTIDDESATIRTTFIGDIAERLLGDKTEIVLKIQDTPDFIKYLEKKSTELLGKDLIVKGKAKYSDFSSAYEIVAFDFQDLNISEELEKTIKEIET